ncbi:unnamed protein product [Urochloa humidicola]
MAATLTAVVPLARTGWRRWTRVKREGGVDPLQQREDNGLQGWRNCLVRKMSKFWMTSSARSLQKNLSC